MKAAKDSLFAKHDEGGTETPEATHNVEAKNGAKEIGDLHWVGLSEDCRVQKKEDQGHPETEEEKHFVA